MDSIRYIKGFSKSYTHRFIILAWKKNIDIIIKKFTKSDDIMATLNALYGNYKIILGDLYLKAEDRIYRDEIYVGESGSTLRFLIPIMLDGKKKTFITNGRLSNRPLNEYKKIILNENGLFEINNNKILIQGKLNKEEYDLSADESSQFVSGMLLASNGNFKVNFNTNKSIQYINITKDAINIFKLNPKIVYVPVDMSNYSFFYGLYKKNFIKSIDNAVSRFQNDSIFINYVEKTRRNYNLKNSIDIAPMLAAFLSTVDGEYEICGLENLKYKESNRLKEILRVLNFFKVIVNTNGVDKIYIKGSSKKNIINGGIKASDHRIAHMILFLKYYHNANVKIKGLDSLKKSDENIYRYFKRRENV